MARDDCMPPSAVDSSKWVRPTPSYIHLPMKPGLVVACATFGKAGVLPEPRKKPSCWGCGYCGGWGEGDGSTCSVYIAFIEKMSETSSGWGITSLQARLKSAARRNDCICHGAKCKHFPPGLHFSSDGVAS